MAISPSKDVDGLHPLNLAKLATIQAFKTPETSPEKPNATWSGPGFSVACTPLAVVELLDRCSVKLEGAVVCVVGRSSLVGIPLAMLLMQRDATVTMVHSKTIDPPEVCQQADIVIVAVGRAELVTAEWIKEGAVVIDVGMNLVRKSKSQKSLVGDVNLAQVEPLCSLITPVPGGVGPVTLAMLLRNTLHAAQRYTTSIIDKFVSSEQEEGTKEEEVPLVESNETTPVDSEQEVLPLLEESPEEKHPPEEEATNNQDQNPEH
mmetsp:Transcript_32175/g.41369  ORF Transcript_32175/g.41369 Transcript_32175/m.41369 type:complete len:262 (+) Transcript_32175:516-1301(+)